MILTLEVGKKGKGKSESVPSTLVWTLGLEELAIDLSCIFGQRGFPGACWGIIDIRGKGQGTREGVRKEY